MRVELMRRPILNHAKQGGLTYEPFLELRTTLMARNSPSACAWVSSWILSTWT